MTVRSLIELAAEPAPEAAAAPPVPPGQPPMAPGNAPPSSAVTLQEMFPTGAAAFYTAVIGVVAGAAAANKTVDFQPYRWAVLGLAGLLTVGGVAVASRSQSGPTSRKVVVVFTAALAFVAWALITPESVLYYILDGYMLSIAVTLIGAGTVAVLQMIIKPWLEEPASPPQPQD